MAKNYKIDIGSKCYYYLYGLERYKSFQEAMEGTRGQYRPNGTTTATSSSPKRRPPTAVGAAIAARNATPPSPFSSCSAPRKKASKPSLGEGMLLSGRGLPSNLARAKLRDGQLIADQVHKNVDELLSMVDDGDEGTLDDLARDPSQLVVEQVDEKSARRLQQLVRGGSPKFACLPSRALGRTGNLDYVPTLLYALTDPDPRVVLEARNGLRFISRNFDGLGPPDDFTEQQRFEAIDLGKMVQIDSPNGRLGESNCSYARHRPSTVAKHSSASARTIAYRAGSFRC